MAQPAKLTLFVVALLALPVMARAQGPDASGEVIVTSNAVAFGPIDVPGFDPGMEIAVIYGDPNAETGNYTLRLRFPDGYRFPVHWHPMAENVTVLSGTFLLGMGDSADESKVATYAPGSFLYIPPTHPHYGGATGETVIQLHGQNPFKIILPETSASR